MTKLTDLLADYTIEATAADAAKLADHGAQLPRPAGVYIPFLPEEDDSARIAAAVAIRETGFEPVPHISARRLDSRDHLETFLGRLTQDAQVRSVFLIAGDLSRHSGPFSDSLSVIETGLFEKYGVTQVGIAGHPDDHPQVADAVLWQAMADKVVALSARRLSCQLVTQFSFDPEAVLAWLRELRERGIVAPVRIGIPGPAGPATLLRYAARCGVTASAKAVAKYGFSLGRLAGRTGPDRFLAQLCDGLAPEQTGEVALHLFPFGGFAQSARWLNEQLNLPVA